MMISESGLLFGPPCMSKSLLHGKPTIVSASA